MVIQALIYNTSSDFCTYAPVNVLIEVSRIGSLAEGISINLTCSSTANPAAGRYTWYRRTASSSLLKVASGQVLSLPSLKRSNTLHFTYVRLGTMWEKKTLMRCCWRWIFQRVSTQTGRKRKVEWHDVGQVEAQRLMCKDICLSLTFPQYHTSISHFFPVANFKLNLHFINKPVCLRLSFVIGDMIWYDMNKYDKYNWGSFLPFAHLILNYPP